MRTVVLLMSIALTFMACSKEEEDSLNPKDYPNSKVYTSDKGTMLILHSVEWYLTKTDHGGDVKLKLLGLTNGDKLTILTHGDGLDGTTNIEMDSDKNFGNETIISFYPTALPSEEFEKSTIIKVYRGSDVLIVELKSGKLKF